VCVCVCVCSGAGVELVFVGTKSGLTRYLVLADNLSDPSVLSVFAAIFYTARLDQATANCCVWLARWFFFWRLAG